MSLSVNVTVQSICCVFAARPFGGVSVFPTGATAPPAGGVSAGVLLQPSGSAVTSIGGVGNSAGELVIND